MKKLLSILLIAALILFAVGCGTTVEADEEELFTRHNDYLSVVIDKETGVNYIVYRDSGGYAGGGSVCPRYNSDGTLYVSEVE